MANKDLPFEVYDIAEGSKFRITNVIGNDSNEFTLILESGKILQTISCFREGIPILLSMFKLDHTPVKTDGSLSSCVVSDLERRLGEAEKVILELRAQMDALKKENS